MVAGLAQIARARAQAIADRLPAVERTDNPIGCYFRVRRKIFGQVATVLDPQSEPLTMIVVRPDPAEREALARHRPSVLQQWAVGRSPRTDSDGR